MCFYLHNAMSGVSTVKYIEKLLQYIQSIKFLVKCLKVVAKSCLNWIIFWVMAPFIVVLGTQIKI